MMSRDAAIGKYEEAKREGKVDEDIVPLLDLINYRTPYYTTSSCSGRIVVMQLPRLGDKKNAEFLGKWHREVRVDEIRDAISKYRDGLLYLFVQSSIIHVVARNMEDANLLLTLAREAGFKYSSLKNVKDEGILIELLSTEHMEIPLGIDGEIKICEGDIPFFTDMANATLRRVKYKLSKLEEKISSLPRASA